MPIGAEPGGTGAPRLRTHGSWGGVGAGRLWGRYLGGTRAKRDPWDKGQEPGSQGKMGALVNGGQLVMVERTKNTVPIAAKVIAEMKRHARGKIVHLQSFFNGRAVFDDLHKALAGPQQLTGVHAAHAAYVFAQNQVSMISELLTSLDALAPIADIVSKAEYEYMPSGPPMSPLTVSYFSSWAFFDACFGPDDETIGTTILDLGASFGMHAELSQLIRLMQQSRMGVYVHEGFKEGLAVLRDIATGVVCRCFVPAGYSGKKGQLWYARVLPPPLPAGSEHIVFTTPYIFLDTPLSEWMAYFRRVMSKVPQPAGVEAVERHMKFGPSRNYWNEFVFEGYINHRSEAIFIAGLPDIPESRPHSPAYRRRGA